MAIRSDTDPNNPASRSGAQKGELDQYGVWVKAEPHDIVEEAASFSDDLDFEPVKEPESSHEESFLSAEEEKLLGSFDSEFENIVNEPEQGPLPDIEDLPPLEESMIEDDSSRRSEPEDVEELDSSTVDISLEELEGAVESSPISPYAEIDIDAMEGLEAPPASKPSPSLSMEDVSTEFLDNLEEAPAVEAGGASFGSDDVTAQFLDIAAPVQETKEEASVSDFEPLDIDLAFDDTIPSEESRAQSEANETANLDGFEEVTEFDDFLAEPESLESTPLASQASAMQSFDDLSAVEKELSSESATARPAAPPSYHDGLDASSEILLKIADELSSIRGELVSLKAQLKGFKPETVEPSPKSEEEESAAAGGFFDEEEDETIALTGDELDNILNTADFTEEAAEIPGSGEDELMESLDELPEHPEPQDIAIIGESILPESGDYSQAAVEPAIEELRLGEAADLEVPERDNETRAPEFEEISLMAEEGVHPMTPAPEDTSYLESALSAEGADFGDALPPDVPLVEPDLSDFDLEAEDLEMQPAMEIDEELPLVELPEASIEEITLSMEAGPGYIEEQPIEVETIETLPEIEESSLEEISLHHEDMSTGESELEELAEIEELPGEDTPGEDTPGEDTRSGDTLSAEIEARTVKPAEPFAIHPDEMPSSLDDSFFIGEESRSPEPQAAAEEVEEIFEVEEELPVAPTAAAPTKAAPPTAAAPTATAPTRGEDTRGEDTRGEERLKNEIKSVLAYLDKLLDSLPEDKIEEFARSQYFDTYKRLFEELGLV